MIKTGDAVKILSLKKSGIVSAVLHNNSAMVAVGSLTIRCKISDLQIQPESKKQTTLNFAGKTGQPDTLDLHGYNSNMARETLIQFISNAVLAGHSEVIVIHGYGTGTIKQQVHKVLSELEAVSSFRHPIDSTAVTKVYLK